MTSSYKQFIKDLNENMIYEQISADKICIRNNTTIQYVCSNYEYDFMTTDGISYEIKCDKASNKTGNFFIEFLGRNNAPSGISSTKADYYIITNSINYYMIQTNVLKSLCKNKRILTLKDKSASGFIIPCSVIIENSIII